MLGQWGFIISIKLKLITRKTEAALQRGSQEKVFWTDTANLQERTPKPKCDFNKVSLQLYWNHNLAWMFSCKLAVYVQNTCFFRKCALFNNFLVLKSLVLYRFHLIIKNFFFLFVSSFDFSSVFKQQKMAQKITMINFFVTLSWFSFHFSPCLSRKARMYSWLSSFLLISLSETFMNPQNWA